VPRYRQEKLGATSCTTIRTSRLFQIQGELKKVVATNMNMDIEVLNSLLSKNKYNNCAVALDTTTSDTPSDSATSDTTSSSDTSSDTTSSSDTLNETINNCPINADNINNNSINDNGKGCESVEDLSLHISTITSVEGGKVVNIRILSL
jgi:hypothetical protein